MKLRISPEFLAICQQIVDTEWSDDEWASHESDDWFRTDHFEGGYDATESAFCFSYVARSLDEYWLQLSLAEVREITEGKIQELSLRPSDLN